MLPLREQADHEQDHHRDRLMRLPYLSAVLLAALIGGLVVSTPAFAQQTSGRPAVLRDLLWVWATPERAEQWTREVAHCPRIVWEIPADEEEPARFVYEHRVSPSAS
jgi:hypothetical protein